MLQNIKIDVLLFLVAVMLAIGIITLLIISNIKK